MNAFEDIVKLYLEAEGYWVRQSVKIDISKQDKREIGLYSMPRPEIDLVALNVKKNELLLIEVKSYLDSYGVYYEAISDDEPKDDRTKKDAKRYRLFTDNKFREVVTRALREEYLKQGLIRKNTKINYALASGNIRSPGDKSKISNYFLQKGWTLFSPEQIKDRIRKLSDKGWEDNIVTITAKLIMKN